MTKEKKTKTKRKVNRMNVAVIIVSIICILEIVCICGGSGMLMHFLKDKPTLSISDFENPESSEIYDVNGKVIAELGMTIRENVSYDDLPTSLIDAFVAVEDSRFFAHNGFDVSRFTKAILENLKSRSFSQGGSTFTMQLVKNTYFVDDEAGINAPKKISRKVQEIALAMELENHTNKKAIMEFYLNKLNFGGSRNIRGIQKAAEYYFSKDVRDLNLAESAMLAGVINAPNAFNPYRNLEKATNRRNEVLYQMFNHGYINKEEYELAKSIKVEDLINDQSSGKGTDGILSPYQAYIDAVVNEVYALTNTDPYSTPMQIYTYMDPQVQSLMDSLQTDDNDVFEWPDEDIEVASISVNTKTGAINAVLGGRNYADGGELLLNHAIDQYKQPGSSIKPIIDYAPAFEYLGWATSHVLVDKPIVYPGTNSVIHNATGNWAGEVTLKDAVGKSLNTTAIQALEQVLDATSVQEMVSYLNKMGFTQITTDNFNIQYGIGGGEIAVSCLQMAGAQAALVNGGQYVKPHTIERIEYLNGKNPVTPVYTPVQAISPQAAYLTSTLLYNNVYGGYANLMQILRDDYAVYAKTGTTDWGNSGVQYGIPVGSIKDAWMVASTSDYTVATWLGYEKASSEKQSYITTSAYLKNIQGKITNLVLDENRTVHGTPEAIVRPDGISSISHILATYPYANPIEGMDSQYITSGLIKSDMVQLVDPQTISDIENINTSDAKVSFDSQTKELSIHWPKYPDASKLESASQDLDISLKRADGSVIIEAKGKKLFDYSWIYGPVRYKADVRINGGEPITITSETEDYKEILGIVPGDNVSIDLYYAYENKNEVRSANKYSASFTLENKPVDLQLPAAGLSKDQLQSYQVFTQYGMQVTINEIVSTSQSQIGTYTFTFDGKEYRPGETISGVMMSSLYNGSITCNYYVASPRNISIAADTSGNNFKANSIHQFTANVAGGTADSDNTVLWSVSGDMSVGINANTGQLTIGDVASGTQIIVYAYLANDASVSTSYSFVISD